jgi:hypothetical protein
MMPGDAESQKLTFNFSHHVRNIASAKGGVINPIPGGVLVFRSRVTGRCPGVVKVKLKIV